MSRVRPHFSDNVYTFGDLNIVSRVIGTARPVYRWYVLCEGCCERIPFQMRKPKIWEATCGKCKMIYTITPWEYSILKPSDFTKIMGDL